jgi:hypothetical protein
MSHAADELEVRRTVEDNSDPAFVAPFDPRTQVSADAKYIVRNLVLWFLVLPAVLGALLWAITH